MRRGPSDSAVVRFLATSGGEVVGRVACSVDEGLAPLHLFAYEAVDDDGVAAALFAAAERQALALGRTSLVGPRGRTAWGSPSGLQVSGHDRPVPALGAHHPPHYRRQWEEVGGFRRTGTILSFAIDRTEVVRPPWLDLAVSRAVAAGYRVPVLREFDELAVHADAVRRLLNLALAELPNSIGTAADDVDALVARLRPVVQPDLVQLVLRGDDVIGLLAGVPELAPALRRTRGRLLPLGWWHLRHELRHGRVLTLQVGAVLPEHQAHGAIAPAIAALLDRVMADDRFQTFELPLVDAANVRSRHFVEGVLGARPVAEYAVYQRDLDSSPSP